MASSLRHDAPDSARCGICGCAGVRLDHWDDPVGVGVGDADADRAGDASLELGECPRCDHRWTRSLAHSPQTRGVSSGERVAPALAVDAASAPSGSSASSAPSEGCPRLPVAA